MSLFSSKAKMRYNHGAVIKKTLNWLLDLNGASAQLWREFLCDLSHITSSLIDLNLPLWTSWVMSETEDSGKSILKSYGGNYRRQTYLWCVRIPGSWGAEADELRHEEAHAPGALWTTIPGDIASWAKWQVVINYRHDETSCHILSWKAPRLLEGVSGFIKVRQLVGSWTRI